jgi:maltose O-acetyltransferase
MLTYVVGKLERTFRKIRSARQERRWAQLQSKGMQIGWKVHIPMSTWIDAPHCFLISIGDNCSFGENCGILAHDAMAKEFLGATILGRVKIEHSCHIGMGTVVLPGVTIGPNSIVGAGSVVTRDIPMGVIAAGNPARVICTLEEYLDRQREQLERSPKFKYSLYDINNLTSDRRAHMLRELEDTVGFMTAG